MTGIVESTQRAQSVLFSCVAENRAEYFTMTQNLVMSIRKFGGALSQAPIVVNFVDGVDDAFADPLQALGADVRVVKRVPGLTPLANKLRMFELDDQLDFDVLIALDCDIVVLGDPLPFVQSESIGAKAADFNRLADSHWEALFAAVGLTPPRKEMTATFGRRPMYPYFNSGVLFVPRALCRPLREGWTSAYARVSELLASRPDLIPLAWQWAAEQAALALALQRERLPWRELPVTLNFPGHVRVRANGQTDRPIILHYHGHRDERGFLLRSPTRSINPWIDAFNRHRARMTSQPYSGLGKPSLRRRVSGRYDEMWRAVRRSDWYQKPHARQARSALKWFLHLRARGPVSR